MQTATIQEQLEAHIASECTAVDTDRAYDEMIDECYSFESIGGPFAYFSPSKVLAEMDPTAYRCGKNDWLDGEEMTEVNGDYYRDAALDLAKEQFIDELNDKASELETEIEELEAEEDPDLQELGQKKRALADLQSDIKEIENHSF